MEPGSLAWYREVRDRIRLLGGYLRMYRLGGLHASREKCVGPRSYATCFFDARLVSSKSRQQIYCWGTTPYSGINYDIWSELATDDPQEAAVTLYLHYLRWRALIDG